MILGPLGRVLRAFGDPGIRLTHLSVIEAVAKADNILCDVEGNREKLFSCHRNERQ